MISLFPVCNTEEWVSIGQKFSLTPAYAGSFHNYTRVVLQCMVQNHICKRLGSPPIDSKESIPPGCELIPGLLKRFTNAGSEGSFYLIKRYGTWICEPDRWTWRLRQIPLLQCCLVWHSPGVGKNKKWIIIMELDRTHRMLFYYL